MTTDNIDDVPQTTGADDSPSSAPLPTTSDSGIDTETTVETAVIDYSTIYPDQHGLTPEQISAQTELFKAAGISVEIAGKIVTDRLSAVNEAIKRGADSQIEKNKSDWAAAQTELQKKAVEKFGDKLDEVRSFIPAAVNKFLPKDEADGFNQFLQETGLHNDPRVITFLSAVGKSVSEDTPSTGAAPDTKPKTTTANLYPNSNMNP